MTGTIKARSVPLGLYRSPRPARRRNALTAEEERPSTETLLATTLLRAAQRGFIEAGALKPSAMSQRPRRAQSPFVRNGVAHAAVR
jgi:hypothetical protein